MNSVLLIDDEEKLRQLLLRIIRLEGFDVQEATNGQAALKQLATQDFDVVLCDVKLPDSNGVDLVKQIKALQPVAEVILLTAYGNVADGGAGHAQRGF